MLQTLWMCGKLGKEDSDKLAKTKSLTGAKEKKKKRYIAVKLDSVRAKLRFLGEKGYRQSRPRRNGTSYDAENGLPSKRCIFGLDIYDLFTDFLLSCIKCPCEIFFLHDELWELLS